MTLSPAVAAAVLLSALLHATWNTLVKTSGDQLLAQAVVMAGAGSLGIVIAAQGTFPFEAWPWLLASVAVHTTYLFTLVHAYSLGDLSQVYPIARGSAPLLIALLAIPLLDEPLGTTDAFGILLISGGILLLASGDRENPGNRRAVFWALATGAQIVAYSLLDGIGVRAAPDVAGYVGWLHIGEAIPITVYATLSRRSVLSSELRENGRAWFAGGVMAAFGYLIVLWAFERGAVAPVASLRETSVVMAAVIGAARLGEPLGARRIAASCIVVAGVALLNT